MRKDEARAEIMRMLGEGIIIRESGDWAIREIELSDGSVWFYSFDGIETVEVSDSLAFWFPASDSSSGKGRKPRKRGR